MRSLFRSIVVGVALALGAAFAASAQSGGSALFESAGTSAKDVSAFLASLQNAVAADDRDAVAALFSYPARVPLKGKSGKVRNKKELLAAYADLFDPALKKLIADARVDTLFANAQGVMLGDGQLWFAPVGAKAKLAVIAINPSPIAKK